MNFTENKFSYFDEDYVQKSKATAALILPMICASLSIIACYVVVRENVADLRTKQQCFRKKSKAVIDPVIPKQFISMGIAYLFWYFGLAMGPIPAPKDDLNDVMGARGTIGTCSTVGFFFQFGIFAAVPLHTCLIWFYMIIVRYNWTQKRLNSYFCWLNGFIWTLSFVVAVIPAFLGYYNFTGANCWLASFPEGCDHSIESNESGNTTCTRGANVRLYKAAITAFPYFPCWIAFIVLFFMIYVSVRKTENRSQRYATTKAYFSFRLGPKAAKQIEIELRAVGKFAQDCTSTGLDQTEQMTEVFGGDFTCTEMNSSEKVDAVCSAMEGTIENDQTKPMKERPESKHRDTEITSSGKSEHADCAPVEKIQAQKSTSLPARPKPKHNPINRTKSNAVATQAMLLISVVFLGIALNTSARALSITTGSIPFAFNLFVDVFLSLTGVFNAIIFCRPRSATDMKTPEGRLFRNIFFDCEICNACARGEESSQNPSSEEILGRDCKSATVSNII